MKCFTLMCVTLSLHLVHCNHSTPPVQNQGLHPLLSRFCNFLQVKTTSTTESPNIVHVGPLSTALPVALSDDDKKLLRQEIYNITHLGFANKRDIDLTLDKLSTNGTQVQSKIARLLISEIHKYLDLKSAPGEETEEGNESLSAGDNT